MIPYTCGLSHPTQKCKFSAGVCSVFHVSKPDGLAWSKVFDLHVVASLNVIKRDTAEDKKLYVEEGLPTANIIIDLKTSH